MKEGWVKIFSSSNLLEAKLAESILKQHDIVSHIAQKPDAVLQVTGEAVLYALPETAEAAIEILKKNEVNL